MPRFDEHHPPTIYELRELWVRYRGNGVVQRVILEIQHLRGFVRAVETLRELIQRCWHDETNSKLVALETLRAELQAEIFRAGVTGRQTPRALPAFVPPSQHDLLALAQHHRGDVHIQILVDETFHARGFVLRVDALRIVIERCWQAETDTQLVALEELRRLVETAKARAGVIATARPAQREQQGLTARIALGFDGMPETDHS